jgi:hypothetical protein
VTHQLKVLDFRQNDFENVSFSNETGLVTSLKNSTVLDSQIYKLKELRQIQFILLEIFAAPNFIDVGVKKWLLHVFIFTDRRIPN